MKPLTATKMKPDEQTALLHTLIHASPLAIVVVDTEGKVTMWSPGAERLTGWTEAEVLGRPNPLVPEDKQHESRSLREVVRTGATFSGAELCRRKKDGSPLMARVSAAPLRDAAGVVRGAVALVADRTERPPTEEALTAALEHERHIAETFQRSLGVPVSEQRFPGLDVAMLHQAAWAEARVGGDFCEAFALNAGKVALFVGDVCGKGLEAAIYSGQLKCALRAFLRESPYPAQALFRLNQFICDAQRLDGQTDPVFTVLSLAVLDPASGEAVMSVAGAEPPLALRAAGEAEAITAPCNLPLGVEAGETYGAATLRLERGDTLLLATDGITEARNGGAFLGYEGMVALAGEASRFDSLRERGSAILQGARAFAGGALHDDACLLLARRR